MGCFSEILLVAEYVLDGDTKESAGITREMRRIVWMVPKLRYLSGTREYLFDETYPETLWIPAKFALVCFASSFSLAFFRGVVPGSTIYTSVCPFTYHPLCIGEGSITESGPGRPGPWIVCRMGRMNGKWAPMNTRTGSRRRKKRQQIADSQKNCRASSMQRQWTRYPRSRGRKTKWKRASGSGRGGEKGRN